MRTIQFIVGDGKEYSPTNGTFDYNNPALLGVDYLVYKNGVGFVFDSKQLSKSYQGGFHLLDNVGFQTDEQYTIIFQ